MIYYFRKWLIILENDLKSLLIFVLFLKGKQNKKETLSVTPYLEKAVYEKSNQSSGVKLLIEKVR